MSRGPRRKPTSAADSGGSTPARRNRARRPSDGVSARAARPRAAIARFSSTSGARSAMVPRQAMRSSGRGSTGRPQAAATACASLSARPTPARPGERVVAEVLARIDQQRAGRQLSARQVVVGDHHVDPRRRSGVDRGRRGDAAVDGDDQAAAELDGPLDVDRLEAVPLAQAVRQDRMGVDAAGAEDGDQERRGGHPVDVVVADHRHPLAGVARRHQARHRGADAV